MRPKLIYSIYASILCLRARHRERGWPTVEVKCVRSPDCCDWDARIKCKHVWPTRANRTSCRTNALSQMSSAHTTTQCRLYTQFSQALNMHTKNHSRTHRQTYTRDAWAARIDWRNMSFKLCSPEYVAMHDGAVQRLVKRVAVLPLPSWPNGFGYTAIGYDTKKNHICQMLFIHFLAQPFR